MSSGTRGFKLMGLGGVHYKYTFHVEQIPHGKTQTSLEIQSVRTIPFHLYYRIKY